MLTFALAGLSCCNMMCPLTGVSVNMNTQRPTEATLLISGIISASVAWGVDEQGKVLVPPISECVNQRYRYN